LQCLVKHGADVNAHTSNGITPLFLVLRKPWLVRILVQVGADVNVREKRQGRTVLFAKEMLPETVEVCVRGRGKVFSGEETIN
jgi:uncharacterized Fe-S cluster protein YjdI